MYSTYVVLRHENLRRFFFHQGREDKLKMVEDFFYIYFKLYVKFCH